jgi:hypothetical protein
MEEPDFRGDVIMDSIYRWLLFAGAFFSLNAQAKYIPTSESSCSTIDLRAEFPMKTRNQKDISWCYAHAAADLLQFTYRIPDQISAADIAINYAESDVSKVITFFKRILSSSARAAPPETGFIKKAIKKTIPEGYCPESLLPSEEWIRVDMATGEKKKVEILEAILESYNIQKKIKNGTYPSAESLEAFYEFPRISRDQFFEILKNTKKGGMLLQIRNQACSGERRPYPKVNTQFSFSFSGRHVFQKINNALSSHLPVGIDFFSGIFDNYDHFKRKIDDLHTVLFFGRKFDPNTHECVYLMKNSYGEECSRYDSKIKCESGYLWFPEKQFYRALTSIVVPSSP